MKQEMFGFFFLLIRLSHSAFLFFFFLVSYQNILPIAVFATVFLS